MPRHIILVVCLWSILLFTLTYISVSRYTSLKKSQTEGFEENVTAKPCKRGYYCPGGTASARYQCPPGTYGDSENLRTSACSGVCRAGCVCEAGSTSDCPELCPRGYKCKAGTMTRITDSSLLEPWKLYPTVCGEWVWRRDKKEYEYVPCPAGTPDTNSFDGVPSDSNTRSEKPKEPPITDVQETPPSEPTPLPETFPEEPKKKTNYSADVFNNNKIGSSYKYTYIKKK